MGPIMRDGKSLLASNVNRGLALVFLMQALEAAGVVPAGTMARLADAIQWLGGMLAAWGLRDLAGGVVAAQNDGEK